MIESHPHTERKRQIIQLDRYAFEHDFQPQHPYLLLSIRRPGSRFARGVTQSQMLSRCDLMLHEWDQAQPPYPLPPVVLQSRQALKMADWLNEHLAVLAVGDCDFVIQSEDASSQRSAFSGAMESILNWNVLNRGTATPHAETLLLLEMALAYSGIASSLCSSRRSRFPVAPSLEVLELISAIFAGLNIDLIVFQDHQPFFDDTEELGAAVINRIAQSLGIDGLNGLEHSQARDFIAGVMRLRQTRCCVASDVLTALESHVEVNEHSTILYVGEIDAESLLALHDEFAGSIQLLLPIDAQTLVLKSRLMLAGRSLLETRLGTASLLSVTHDRDWLLELLHANLRTNPRNLPCR